MKQMNFITTAFFVAAPLTANAELSDLEVFQLAGELGNIIGSAEACDLSIDQDGVMAWIETNVPGGDLSFASQMTGQASATKIVIDDYDATTMMAHCIAVKSAAQGAGLLAE